MSRNEDSRVARNSRRALLDCATNISSDMPKSRQWTPFWFLIRLAEGERELHLLPSDTSGRLDWTNALVVSVVLRGPALRAVSREFNDSSRTMAPIKRNDQLFRRVTSFNCTIGSAGNFTVDLHYSSIIAAVLLHRYHEVENAETNQLYTDIFI